MALLLQVLPGLQLKRVPAQARQSLLLLLQLPVGSGAIGKCAAQGTDGSNCTAVLDMVVVAVLCGAAGTAFALAVCSRQSRLTLPGGKIHPTAGWRG
jgi:hypothetical protein